MKKSLGLFLLITAIVSCKKIQDKPTGTFLTGDGVFIIDEGNFRSGNGSLSFYSYDSSKVYNDLFSSINGRPLGDVPNSMGILDNKAYIIVNNSGKIEVINKSTLKSIATVNGLISPRNISFVNYSKAYITSMYSDSIIILSLKDYSISGYINIRRSSESIAITGGKAYVANWVGGKEVMVINTETDEVIDSIEVGVEPESMVTDKNQLLWVLCNGGWMRENFAELIGINTSIDEIEKRFVFPAKLASPSCLQIDGSRETLYYLENGVQRMGIAASGLPTVPFIPQSGSYFYKIGINPANGDVFVTDAVDYQQNGLVIYYNKDGTLVSTHSTDIIPGIMYFKVAFHLQEE